MYVNTLIRRYGWIDIEILDTDALRIFLFPHFGLVVTCIELNSKVILGFREYHTLGERTLCGSCLGCCLPLVEERTVVVLVYKFSRSVVNDTEMLFAIIERIYERDT